MNNYRLYAKLFHKPDSSNLSAVPCEVEKWIPINHWTFEQIKRSPLLDLEVVKAYHSNMFYDNGINHCIMLLDDCGNGGILVESEGYDYPRYSCFVPNARTLYEDHLISNNESETNEEITEQIRDYYVLPYEKIKANEEEYRAYTSEQIAEKTRTGVSRSTINDLERMLTLNYCPNIDYYLMLGHFSKGLFSAERGDRILGSGFVSGSDMISACSSLYSMVGTEGRYKFIKWVWKKYGSPDIRNWGFLDELYSKNKKDLIYYGLIAECLNKNWDRG